MPKIIVTIEIVYPDSQDSEPFIPQLEQYCTELVNEFPDCSAEIVTIEQQA